MANYEIAAKGAVWLIVYRINGTKCRRVKQVADPIRGLTAYEAWQISLCGEPYHAVECIQLAPYPIAYTAIAAVFPEISKGVNGVSKHGKR